MPSKTVGYVEPLEDRVLADKIKNSISRLANKHNFKELSFVHEIKLEDFYYTHWHGRKIFEVFNGLEAGDNLIVNEFSSLSNSFYESFYIARQIIDKGINLYSCHEKIRLNNLSLNKIASKFLVLNKNQSNQWKENKMQIGYMRISKNNGSQKFNIQGISKNCFKK